MKKVIGMSLVVVLLGTGLYTYAWFQAASTLKEEWVTLVERLNNKSHGVLRVQYDTIQTTGFPRPEIKILLKNLSLTSSQPSETSPTPFTVALGNVQGLIRLNDDHFVFTFDKVLQLNYSDAESQQPVAMKIVHQAAPTLTVTRSITNKVFLKKLLFKEKMKHWMDAASLQSLVWDIPAFHNELAVEGRALITDKSEGMQMSFTQKTINKKRSFQLLWSVSNYELTAEYFEYLIKNTKVPQKMEFFQLLKKLNAALGPVSLKYDMAFLGDLDNLSTAWKHDALDINLLSIQSQLGGLDITLHAMPGDVCGYVKLSNYATFIPELITQYNAIITSEYGKMMAASMGMPATPIETAYAEGIQSILKKYGKPMENDLRFDYEELPTGDIDVNNQPSSKLLEEMLAVVTKESPATTETVPAAEQTDSAAPAAEAAPVSESSDASIAEEVTEQPPVTEPVAPKQDAAAITQEESLEEMDASDVEPIIESTQPKLSPEEEKRAAEKRIEALEAAKQQTLKNIESLKKNP